jgi:hypothetical protein
MAVDQGGKSCFGGGVRIMGQQFLISRFGHSPDYSCLRPKTDTLFAIIFGANSSTFIIQGGGRRGNGGQ